MPRSAEAGSYGSCLVFKELPSVGVISFFHTPQHFVFKNKLLKLEQFKIYRKTDRFPPSRFPVSPINILVCYVLQLNQYEHTLNEGPCSIPVSLVFTSCPGWHWCSWRARMGTPRVVSGTAVGRRIRYTGLPVQETKGIQAYSRARQPIF